MTEGQRKQYTSKYTRIMVCKHPTLFDFLAFFAILTPLTAAAPLINLEQYANKKAEYENK